MHTGSIVTEVWWWRKRSTARDAGERDLRLMASHGYNTQMSRRQKGDAKSHTKFEPLRDLPRAWESAPDVTRLLTGCHLHAVLRRGKDVADWRELAHQMHGSGFGPQHFKRRGGDLKRDLQG